MARKPNNFGISDDELLCDEMGEVCISPSDAALLGNYSSATPFIDDEERRTAKQIESFVLRRMDSRKTAYAEVQTEFNAKEEKLTKTRRSVDGVNLAGKRRFPKFFDFLETLSREDSAIRIASKDEETVDHETMEASFTSNDRLANVTLSNSAANFNLTKLDASLARFAPPNFSTPKDSMSISQPQLPSFQNVSQTPTVLRKSGHPTLTRTDTTAARLPFAPSIFGSQKVEPFAVTSSVTSGIKQPVLAVSPLKINGQSLAPTKLNGFGNANKRESLLSKAKPSSEVVFESEEIEEERRNGLKEAALPSSSTAIENTKKPPVVRCPSSKSRQFWMSRMPFNDFLIAEEIAEASFTELDSQSKDVLRSLAKRSIREKIACWTRKNANKEVIRNAVDYFDDLLTGKTVYGFDGKMLNFSDDEPGIKFSMAWIVSCYVNVVQRDNLLLECAATVLLSMMNKILVSKSIIYSKLFAASPLLTIDKDECLKQIGSIKLEDNNTSEAVNSWCGKQSSIIRLFVLLHCPKTKKDAILVNADFDFSSKLWSVLAAAATDESPFASALAAEVLKLAGGHLAKAYGLQFQKLLAFISKRTLLAWNESLKKDSSICGLSRMAVGYYLAVLDLALKECSAS